MGGGEGVKVGGKEKGRVDMESGREKRDGERGLERRNRGRGRKK